MTQPHPVPAGNSPIDRYAVVVGNPETMEVVGQRVIEGETLMQIARAWQVPVMRFVEWVVNDAVRCGQYQAALKVRADVIANETLAIADGVDESRVVKGENGQDIVLEPDSRRDSLRVRTRLQLAGHFDPTRFGAKVEKNVNVRLGRLASEMTDDELMALIERSSRDARVIEGKSTEVVAEAKRITEEPIVAGTGDGLI